MSSQDHPLLSLFRGEAERCLGRLELALLGLSVEPADDSASKALSTEVALLISTCELVDARGLALACQELALRLGAKGPLQLDVAREMSTLRDALKATNQAIVEVKSPPIPPASAELQPELLPFFLQDLDTCVRELSAGLVRFDDARDLAELLDRLMRAAHSIKGAARAAGCDLVVTVAHVMEECFVAAQRGELLLSPGHIDVLLSSADQLESLSRAGSADFVHALSVQAQGLRGIAEQISRFRTDEEPSTGPGSSSAHAAPSTEQPSLLEDVGGQLPEHAVANETGGDARVIRVAAGSIERLVGLAGEALVEARHSERFVRDLDRLRRQQASLLEQMQGDQTRAHSEAVWLDSQILLRDCQRATSELWARFEEYARTLEEGADRLYSEALRSRMRPFSDGTASLARLARDTGRRLGKAVDLRLRGQQTEVDRDVLEALQLPLQHLVRNAIDHGLESTDVREELGKERVGKVVIEAHHIAGQLLITIADDGRGVDLEKLKTKLEERGLASSAMLQLMSEAELLEFLFLPGLSTAAQVTDISGRGVGLDVVRSAVDAVGGQVHITTRKGRGTTFHLRLPITRAVIRAVITDVAGEPYAFPLLRVERIVRVQFEDVQIVEGRQFCTLDGRNVGIVRAHQILETPEAALSDSLLLIVIGEGNRSVALVVDAFMGERDLVIRALDARLGKVPNLLGAAILDNGSPVMVLDVDDLLRSIERLLQTSAPAQTHQIVQGTQSKKRVLVVDDSITVRELQRQLLLSEGYDVDVAVDGADGWLALDRGKYDLVISDIDMPRMNGFQLVKQIKQDERLRSLPVVIVSYKDRPEDRLKGLDAGANYYLTKTSFHDRSYINAVIDLIGAAA